MESMPAGFDFIVVGGGAAGCVLASRLAESRKAKVLLVEAGEESDLGGISNVPSLPWTRGLASDYDNWAAQGALGWKFANVLPCLMKAEDASQVPAPEEEAKDFRGREGPMIVSQAESENAALERFAPPGDYNKGFTNNVIGSTQSVRGGLSTYAAYIEPHLDTKYLLTTVTGARAVGVAMDDKNKATGVTFKDSEGKMVTVGAAREVVLAAGVLGSPQLLMLSGVGPKDALEQVGVDVRVDSPGVGENLQDHYTATYATDSLSAGSATGFLQAADDTTFQVTLTEGSGAQVQVCNPKSRGRISLESSDPSATPVVSLDFEAEDQTAHIAAFRHMVEIAKGDMSDEEILAVEGSHVGHPVGTCAMGDAENNSAVVDPSLRVKGVQDLRVADASVFPSLTSGNPVAPIVAVAEMCADLIKSAHSDLY